MRHETEFLLKIFSSQNQSTGQYDNTIFAFSSDNGGLPYQGANNYPYRGWKFSLWEGGVRSPGFIAGPGIKQKDYHNLFHVVDWMPTLLDAAGLKRLTLIFFTISYK